MIVVLVALATTLHRCDRSRSDDASTDARVLRYVVRPIRQCWSLEPLCP